MASATKPTGQATAWPDYMARCAHAAKDDRLRRFLESWTLTPDQPLGETPLVALDMETTGLDPGRHSIVSIGLVPFTLARIQFSQRRHWLLQPRFRLQEQSVTVHRITHSALLDAPDLTVVLEEVLAGLSGRLPVVHYRSIERGFLDSALRFRLGEGLQFPVIDTMELEARVYRQSIPARLRRWLGGQPVSIRMQASRSRYGLPAYQPHHAVIDALATAELFQAQAAARYGSQTPVGELWG